VPWALLPALRGRPVTVAPSASTWLAARGAADGAGGGAGGAPARRAPVLLVAGPGLTHAQTEVDSVAAIHPSSRTIHGRHATVHTVLDGLNGSPLAHLAAHGHHQPENVLFSCLDLVDGPLMAYDVYGLASPPAHVVLSACDVGRTVVSAGDEILGFTAALLYAGTRTVISSVVRLPDETAVEVMSAYHRQLAAGAGPAQALAAASLADPLASFVCFGAG
jgi:CHAT domain-containing protein